MSRPQEITASPHEIEQWAIYLRHATRDDKTLDCVLLIDGAWMYKGSANKAETVSGRSIVMHRPRLFSTQRAAREYRTHHSGNDARTYVAEWVQP